MLDGLTGLLETLGGLLEALRVWLETFCDVGHFRGIVGNFAGVYFLLAFLRRKKEHLKFLKCFF
ncbi:hypothetical protein [Sporosarcina beigongshangi]|uniref:hypothetical protein n=1 Tax=Sporosarcina beigongshangi TaxID=2782538 RepID=UPI002ACDF17E|nr:hypothetical protein [Sporosarcina beigongshangi]